MSIELSLETQQLIRDRMKLAGEISADELVRLAIRSLDERQGEDFEDLSLETQRAIDEAEAQYSRGEARPWEEVKRELQARFPKA